MKYHDITKNDMMNGSGLRVCLWVSGCSHKCKKCQNPITWNPNDGIEFDLAAQNEIFKQLSKKYISGITFTGGDPLHENNLNEVSKFIKKIRHLYPEKSIWLYTGFKWEEIFLEVSTDEFDIKKVLRCDIVQHCHVVVDGKFEKDKADVNYPWAGSTNQRVIDVEKTLEEGQVILWNQK